MPSESLRLTLPGLPATEALARRIAALLHPGDAILLAGPLGAGKTALARALLRHLAHDPALEVPSPSYTLVQEYELAGCLLTHFDLWRLDGPADLVEIGWEAARTGVVLVEWPERLGECRPLDALSIDLIPGPADHRDALLTGWPGRLEGLALDQPA